MTQNLPEYDALRRRVQSQFSQRRGEAADAMQRRYASQGMLGSGAYQKQQRLQEQELGRDEQEALGQIDFAQTAEARRIAERGEDKTFARGEREATQAYQTGEREGSQKFNQGLFDRDMKFKYDLHKRDDYWKEIDDYYRKKEFEQNTMNNYTTAYLGLADADISDEEKNAIMDKLGAYLPEGKRPNARFGGGGTNWGDVALKANPITAPLGWLF